MTLDSLRLQNLIYWFIYLGEKMETEIADLDSGTKECFGEQCRGCDHFFGCEEHFPFGCWGEE